MDLNILFVCTGNTCRSPMAEGLAREILAESFLISSAGLEANEGESASSNALIVLKEQRIDLSKHRSRRIKAEHLANADWIIPMTQAQEEALRRLFPQYVEKIRLLGAWGDNKRDVHDPWSGSLEVYRRTAYEIRELLSALKDHLT